MAQHQDLAIFTRQALLRNGFGKWRIAWAPGTGRLASAHPANQMEGKSTP
jgi:hypothetical protein